MYREFVRQIGVTAAVWLTACGLAAAAGTPPDPPSPAPRAAAAGVRATTPRAGGVVAARSTSIVGVAWNADNTPIPGARVRLRNVVTGRIATAAIANEAGQFTFAHVEGGSYLIELVTESGKILTVGHTFTVAPGEAVATFVRLSARVPWFTGFFGNAASALASTAASAGVTAIAPDAKPCSSPSPGCS
jgi:hypothetical protein